MTSRELNFFMNIAVLSADMSYSNKLKVGAIIVKKNHIISYSWNGTPQGWDNTTEDKSYIGIDSGSIFSTFELERYWPFEDENGRYKYVTKPEVLHAEEHAILKLAKNGKAGKNSTIFTTHYPCIKCAKMVHNCGIKKIYYIHNYYDEESAKYLAKTKIKVKKLFLN